MKVINEELLVKSPVVTVQVYAYNKEKYIRECLDSVVGQETDFEYDILIMQNPGTDKTREICLEYQKKYPEKIILVLREENMGFYYNYFEAERTSRGKYIARCDADDYWCDMKKLQKQVDFLESHPEYGCCYTKSRNYDDETGQFTDDSLPWKGFKAELLRDSIQQPSIMYRKDLVNQYLDEIKPEGRGWKMEDTPRNLWLAYHTNVERLDDVTTIYRVVNNSASHQTDYAKQEAYHKSILDIRLFFYNLYCPGEKDLIKPLYNDFYNRNIYAAYRLKKMDAFLKNLLKFRFVDFKTSFRHAVMLIKLPIKIILNK